MLTLDQVSLTNVKFDVDILPKLQYAYSGAVCSGDTLLQPLRGEQETDKQACCIDFDLFINKVIYSRDWR